MRRLSAGYWTWLGSRLHLTLAGRVVFTVVALLGLAGIVGDDTTGGNLGPNEAAALAFYVIVVLLAVVAADLLVIRPLAMAARRLRHPA